VTKLARTPKKAIIYSSASEYAIRALVHLAGHSAGEFISLKHIAKQEDLPLCFLSTIFQRLVRQGMLRSRKGLRGGFTLRQRPAEIRLLDVVDALDRSPCYSQCAMGYPECSEQNPCPMHEGWKVVRSSIQGYLQHKTIADLASQRAGTWDTRRRPSRRARTARRARV
jgi:Rrf2 family iron-sulfur cluster assembly transcriptional regulator